MIPQPGQPQGGAPQPQQQQGGGGIDLNQIMEMIMGLLTQPPNQPAGNVPTGLPASGAPQMAKQMSPEDQQKAMLLQLVQQVQNQASGQQMQNGVQGQAGAMFGQMGGRPRGS